MTVSSTPFRPPKTWTTHTKNKIGNSTQPMHAKKWKSSIKLSRSNTNLYLNYGRTLRTYSLRLNEAYRSTKQFSWSLAQSHVSHFLARTLQHNSHPIALLTPDTLKNLQRDSSLYDHCRQRHHPLCSEPSRIILNHVLLHPHRYRPHAVNNERRSYTSISNSKTLNLLKSWHGYLLAKQTKTSATS